MRLRIPTQHIKSPNLGGGWFEVILYHFYDVWWAMTDSSANLAIINIVVFAYHSEDEVSPESRANGRVLLYWDRYRPSTIKGQREERGRDTG